MNQPTAAISIVNLTHPDPAGTAYYPPSTEHPYWRGPDKKRLAVCDVWAGTDQATRDWIFDLTLDFFYEGYRAEDRKQTANGKIFKGLNTHTYLLSELQSQLGRDHWETKRS